MYIIGHGVGPTACSLPWDIGQSRPPELNAKNIIGTHLYLLHRQLHLKLFDPNCNRIFFNALDRALAFLSCKDFEDNRKIVLLKNCIPWTANFFLSSYYISSFCCFKELWIWMLEKEHFCQVRCCGIFYIFLLIVKNCF